MRRAAGICAALILLCLYVPGLVAQQQMTAVTASKIVDAGGKLLAKGQVTFVPTYCNGTPAVFHVGGGGLALPKPAMGTVVNGAITTAVGGGTFQVPDTASTQPAGLCYDMTVKDTVNTKYSYTVRNLQPTGTTWSLDSFVPGAKSVGAPPTPEQVNGPLNVNGAGNFNGGVTGSSGSFSGDVSGAKGSFGSVAVGTTSLTQANATGVCQMASALGFALDDSDETAKLQALITKWADGGTGGCMAVDAGKTLGVYGQISIPETTTFAAPPPSPAVGITRLFLDASAPGVCTGGGTAQAQCKWNGSAWVSAAPYALPSMRITGSAPAMTLSDIGGLPVGSSILDLRYAGNRLTSVAFTTLEIDHLLVKNNGSNCGAFFFSTLTSMRIHDNGFLGAKSGMNACDDVWIAGGTHNVNSMHGDYNDYFQGYGSYMVHNGADQIRRLLLAGAAFNGIPVKDNLIGRGSGSSLTLPITAATNAASAVLTTADEPRTYFAGHNLPIGRTVPLIFTGFTGNWTSLNGAHNATATDASHLTVAVDSSGFGPLTGTPAYYNGAAIEFSSGNDEPVLGGVQQGAQIDGNIIEQTGYAFCVKMLTGFRNKIRGTGCYDTTVNSSAFFWFGNATKGNITELSGPDLLANVWDASTNGGNPILTFENGYPILASVGNAGIGQVVQSINGTALAGIDSGAISGTGVYAENAATNTPALKAANKSTGTIAEFFSGATPTQKVYIDKDGNIWTTGTVQANGVNGFLIGSNPSNKILSDGSSVYVEADNRLYLGRSGLDYVTSDGWHFSKQVVQAGSASPQSAGQLGIGSGTATSASAGPGSGAMCSTPGYLVFYLGSVPIKIPYCGN